jgi:hypothetical protein
VDVHFYTYISVHTQGKSLTKRSVDKAIKRLKDLTDVPGADPGFQLTRSQLYVRTHGGNIVLHRIRDVIGNYLYKPIFR